MKNVLKLCYPLGRLKHFFHIILKILLKINHLLPTLPYIYTYIYGFLGGTVVKNLPAMQETWETQVLSLGQEDVLGEEMATHSSILAWEFPLTEEPGRHSP